MKEKVELTAKEKRTKILSIIINTLSAIILLVALLVLVTSFISKDKGYTPLFGKSYLIVVSDSMKVTENPQPDNFQAGDIICIKLLNESEKFDLRIGTVVSFYDSSIRGIKTDINSHRIVKYVYENAGETTELKSGDTLRGFMTQGDNHEVSRVPAFTSIENVIGKFDGKATGLGSVIMFLQSKTGFITCVLIPCILVVIYCIINVVLHFAKYSKSKSALKTQDDREALKEQLRQELLKEMAENEKKEKPEEDKETTSDEVAEEKIKKSKASTNKASKSGATKSKASTSKATKSGAKKTEKK